MEGLILEEKEIQEKEKLKNKLIDLRTKVLSNYKDPQLMFSAFKTESDTIKGYNGRQVLELFQNCDDENSPEVLIKIDKERNVFSISNIGTPFSEKGYDSLFYASLSSKISGKFIGNKGLGFRSIINWANEINIYSNDICLKYAPKFIKKAFTELYPSHKERLELLEERGLVENVIPLPLLSYPDISEKKLDNGYTTTIEIFYKEGFYQNIVEQVKSITEETLLFLNTIKHVKFEGFDNQKNIEVTQKNKLEIVTNKTTPTSIITINNKSWNIIEETNQLDEKYQNKESTKKDFYQLKIAFQNDFSDTVYKLYSYFLTEEELYFPFLVHGTFELNQNRKRISNDINEEGISKNGFILNRLALLIINTAKSFSNSEKSNWKPLLFLKHNKTNASLNVFFETLENKILSEKLFPCVDNSYKKRDDVLYISDSFSKMIQNLSLESFFPNHIIPIDEKNINLSIYQIKNTITNITELVNSISKIKLSIENRALFIYEIVKAFPVKQFDFLIDENEIPIKANEYIFTPKTGEKDLIKPKKTTINFLNKDLYVKLSNLFGFDSAKSVGRSRFVMQKLNNNCNIHEYEPNRLALKIISETNDKLKITETDSVSLIQEMNKCLYHNFRQTDDIYNFNKETSVPTINKNGEIAICKNLYLSADYPKGKLTEQIFENIYDQSEYIASPSKLGLDVNDEDFDINKVEDFLIWILTNTYAKYVSYDLISSGLNNYVQYVQNYNSSIVDYRGYTISYKEIVGFENILNQISIDKLLLWINVDNELEQQLIDDQNNIIYKLRFVYKRVELIINKPSYIKYQILSNSKFQFHNHLIDDKTEWLNDIKINYDSPLFINNQIIKLKINNSLLLLNAKEDFNHLSISYVTSLFEKLNNYTIKKEGKGSQAFYKKVYNHFKQNGKELTKKVNLFAKSNGTIHLFKQEEIYFSDNIKLPENLTDKYPIFNYPSRAGGSEAINIFKINDIKNLNTRLNHYVKNETLSDAFNKIFIDLKPFILSFRLENLKTEKSKENDVSKLKNIEIELSDKIECAIETSTFIIDDYEYYYKGNNRYLITVKNKNIKDILLEPKFADSFAEILASTFDTNNEKDDFRYLIRNSEAYNIHLIEQKFGLSIIDEAKVLLGQANEKISFWKNIYDIKEWSTQNLENNDYSKILEVLDNQSLPNIGYSNINNTQNYKIIQSLFNKLNIDIITFNRNAIDKIDLYDLNYKKIEQALEKKSSLIKSSIWKYLEKASIYEQANYLTIVGESENKYEFVSKQSEQFRFQFKVDLDKIVKSYIEEKHPNLDLFLVPDLYEKRALNLNLFNSEQQYFIESKLRFKSLIFFKSAIETVRKELTEKESEEQKTLVNTPIEILTEEINNILLDSDCLISKNISKTKFNRNRSVYVPSISNEKKKKEKGNSSEKTVLDYFIKNKYKDIDHVAKFDEGLHYDIRYTNESGNVKYVEVKTFDYGSFYLSKSEYNFGSMNKENYEIWLVKDKNIIIPIYDFFSNPKYKTTINEYIIHLEIANN